MEEWGKPVARPATEGRSNARSHDGSTDDGFLQLCQPEDPRVYH